GEVEPVIVMLNDGLWIGLGSDHTDRKAETMGIALSKQLCGKVVGSELWKFDHIAPHWDSIIIRSYATIDGERTLYQEGAFALMRDPVDLMTRYGSPFGANTIIMCGTIGTIKDLFDVAGEATRAGSRILADAPPAKADAPIVRRLRAAGVIIVAKTNMTEFAFSGVGMNPHYGTPGNPADRARVPGGSS